MNHEGFSVHDSKLTEYDAGNVVNRDLNIGPKGDGTVPKETVDAFSALGKWMDVNSESILGTRLRRLRKID